MFIVFCQIQHGIYSYFYFSWDLQITDCHMDIQYRGLLCLPSQANPSLQMTSMHFWSEHDTNSP